MSERMGPRKPLVCKRCDNREFYSRGAYQSHLDDSPFHSICDICCSDFRYWDDLLDHYDDTGHAKVCNGCPFYECVWAPDSPQYRKHLIDEYVCAICHQHHNSRKQLEQHSKTHRSTRLAAKNSSKQAQETKIPVIAPTPKQIPEAKIPVVSPGPKQILKPETPVMLPTSKQTPKTETPVLAPKPKQTPNPKSPVMLPTPNETPEAKTLVTLPTSKETPKAKGPDITATPFTKCLACENNFPRYSDMILHIEDGQCCSGQDHLDLLQTAARCKGWSYFISDHYRPGILTDIDSFNLIALDAMAVQCPFCGARFAWLSELFHHCELDACKVDLSYAPVAELRKSLAENHG